MSYLDLVQALEAEVTAEIRRIEETAQADVRATIEGARAEAEHDRRHALAEAAKDYALAHTRALAAAAAKRARAELLERERLLDVLRGAVAARLPELRLAQPLLDELLPEISGPAEIVVAPAESKLTVPSGARIVEDARISGVLVRMGRVVLDNTLPSRLERLWPHVAPRAARVLFGAGDGAL
jgi:V/A-type H+/Na+-transporting ATPase subunit E